MWNICEQKKIPLKTHFYFISFEIMVEPLLLQLLLFPWIVFIDYQFILDVLQNF